MADPSIEQPPRRGSVYPYRRQGPIALSLVLSIVQEDICKSVANFLRALQCPHVISPSQDTPESVEEPVDRPGQPRPDSLHPACQGILILSLDEQVHMIVLNRVRHDAKVRTRTHFSKAALKDPKEGLATHRRHAAHHPNRDVRGLLLQHFVSLDVMNDRPCSGRPSRSGPQPPHAPSSFAGR